MRELFITVLNASVSGSIVIGVVILPRQVLKKAPKKFICLLWLLAGLRLLVPVEIESNLSLQPRVEPVTESQWAELENYGHFLEEDEVIDYGTPLLPESSAPAEAGEAAAVVEPEIKRTINWPVVIPYLWLIGACAMGLYTAAAYLRLHRRVRDAVILSEGVWVSGKLGSAFVLGFFRPQVYLPAGLSESERELVLAHERCHIRRCDPWWKLLGFGALVVHWFNPLVWVAYGLLCRDLEMACDEAVVKNMDAAQRKVYSAALLSCSAKRHSIAACPVAFGEVSVKQRIQKVLHYRKPGFWMILIALLAVAVVAVCFLTTPEGWTEAEMLEHFCEAVEELQSQEDCHILITMDIDAEMPYYISQTQEFWKKENGDWYRTFEYETIHGIVNTVYMQSGGVQYACEYSDEIEYFEDRGWQKIPESNYAPLPPILTKDFRKLEVLEVSSNDEGFVVTVQNDWVPEDSREKVDTYTYTFCFDQTGELTEISAYSIMYSYEAGPDFERYVETKTSTQIYFLTPDSETCSQLIQDGLRHMQ